MSLRAILDVFEESPDEWDTETRLLAVVLGEMMGDHDGLLFCWPGLPVLCGRTRLSKSTVLRRLEILEQSGWIRTWNRYEGTLRLSNLYLWRPPAGEPVCPVWGGVTLKPRGPSADTRVVSPADTRGGVTADTTRNQELEPRTEPCAPAPRRPQPGLWTDECEHGAPRTLTGLNCAECRGIVVAS